MSKNIFYHNPRCRKSREGLQLVKGKNIEFEVVEYLKNPPTKQELNSILKSMRKSPLDVMRTQEKIFKELNLSKKDNRNDDEWIEIMVKNPILIERPILVYNNKAALGRPSEELLKII
jgi:arsenate reductase